MITLDGSNLKDPLAFLLMIDCVSSAVPPSTNIQRATLKIIVKYIVILGECLLISSLQDMALRTIVDSTRLAMCLDQHLNYG